MDKEMAIKLRAALEAMACEQPVIIAGNEGYLRNF